MRPETARFTFRREALDYYRRARIERRAVARSASYAWLWLALVLLLAAAAATMTVRVPRRVSGPAWPAAGASLFVTQLAGRSAPIAAGTAATIVCDGQSPQAAVVVDAADERSLDPSVATIRTAASRASAATGILAYLRARVPPTAQSCVAHVDVGDQAAVDLLTLRKIGWSLP